MTSMVEMITTIAPLTIAEYAEMPYSSVVLLDSKIGALLTDAPEFPQACKWGFDFYFDEMYQWNADQTDLLFVARSYQWAEVVFYVLENLLHCQIGDRLAGLPSPAHDAGFVLGWLSALALTDRQMAMQGLTVLETVVAVTGEDGGREFAASWLVVMDGRGWIGR